MAGAVKVRVQGTQGSFHGFEISCLCASGLSGLRRSIYRIASYAGAENTAAMARCDPSPRRAADRGGRGASCPPLRPSRLELVAASDSGCLSPNVSASVYIVCVLCAPLGEEPLDLCGVAVVCSAHKAHNLVIHDFGMF